MSEAGSEPVVLDRIGAQGLADLVEAFYARVVEEPLLRPLYPDDDLTESKRDLREFLIQYWGGPTTYSDRKGHPRLRMRHVDFAIGVPERDAWLRSMFGAIEATVTDEQVASQLAGYFANAATHLINHMPDAPSSGRSIGEARPEERRS